MARSDRSRSRSRSDALVDVGQVFTLPKKLDGYFGVKQVVKMRKRDKRDYAGPTSVGTYFDWPGSAQKELWQEGEKWAATARQLLKDYVAYLSNHKIPGVGKKLADDGQPLSVKKFVEAHTRYTLSARQVTAIKRLPEKFLPSAKPLLKAFFSMLP